MFLVNYPFLLTDLLQNQQSFRPLPFREACKKIFDSVWMCGSYRSSFKHFSCYRSWELYNSGLYAKNYLILCEFAAVIIWHRKISVWRTIHDFDFLRFIFKIIFEMKYFHRNYVFLVIASALTTVCLLYTSRCV